MASLFDQQIDLTYQGLVKFDDNGTVLPTTLKTLTDGTGGTLPLSLSQVETKFTSGSLVDFTGTTVTGLPADINTTYTIDSVQDGLNADIKLVDQLGNSTKVTLVAGDNVTLTNSGNDLTIDAPDTNTTYTVGSVQDGLNADIKLTDQLGNQSKVTLVAGTNITLTNLGSDLTIDASGGAAGLVSGVGADSMISASTLTTTAASALSVKGIALGNNARAAFYAGQSNGIAIGTDALSEATNSIAIGKGAHGQSGDEIAIGTDSHARLGDGIAIGRNTYAGTTGNIAIGLNANCDYQYTGAMALGTNTVITATGGIALGASVTAGRANTLSTKELELQTVGGGVVMYSPDGTGYKLTVANGGTAVFTAI